MTKTMNVGASTAGMLFCIFLIGIFPETIQQIATTIQQNATAIQQTSTTISSSNKTEANEEKEFNTSCTFAPGLTVGNEMRIEECCNETMRNFHLFWERGNLYLTTYLLTLRSWGCPQFEQECKDRLFAFNPFTELVFDYFCNLTHFVDQCFNIVNSTYEEALMRVGSMPKASEPTATRTLPDFVETNDSMINEWRELARYINSSVLTIDELLVPCVQVTLYDKEEEIFGDYVEIIRIWIPSCGINWCGFSGASIRSGMVSVWNCLTKDCQAKVISIMVILAFIAVAITFANLSVILVYLFNPVLLHSQGVYKLSLAFADIIVGLVVVPTFITSLNKLTSSIVSHAELVNVTGFETINDSLSENISVAQVRRSSGHFSTFFDQTYLNFIGFFTIVSFSVSIYCLTIAGFDRLSAVYRPLSYRKDKAKTLAKWLCLVMWGCGVFFALIPLFVSDFVYSLVASVLAASAGNDFVLILYGIAFVIPLLVMWVVNIMTFHSTCQHARFRRKLRQGFNKKTDTFEIRLARTLSIMVGVFTLSLLPAAITILAPLFINGISFSTPKTLIVQSAIAYNVFEFVAIVILACNSLWNFFIYNSRNLEFRKAVRVLYGKLSKKIGLAVCCSKFLSCAQSVVHDGRRRISSVPITSAFHRVFGKKPSLVPTSTTEINMSDLSSSTEESQKKTSHILNNQSGTAGSSSLQSSKFESTSRHGSETSISSNSKKKFKNKKQNNNNSQVSEDSIFQSFAVDANADRLFESVMDRIEEEIIVAE